MQVLIQLSSFLCLTFFTSVGHNLILSHAYAVKLYRNKYQASQNGTIGIMLNCGWYMPYNEEAQNVAATQRVLESRLGWFAGPIYKGAYPASLKDMLGDWLPNFTAEDIAVVHGSSDFFGINT
ncbi:glycoside hydrolase superfamily [Mycena floridula]|nr:glycoside hydrolase superfamily [Mycena floridula]